MCVIGFKAFNIDMTNRYGMRFELNKTYIASGSIVWGNHGNGFHFCKNLEDTFRYFDALNSEVLIGKVIGDGTVLNVCDEYYGYYDMYVSETIQVTDIMSRHEIINYLYTMVDSFSIDRNKINRFISGFRLSEEEIDKLLEMLSEKDYSYMENYLFNVNLYQRGKVKEFRNK